MQTGGRVRRDLRSRMTISATERGGHLQRRRRVVLEHPGVSSLAMRAIRARPRAEHGGAAELADTAHGTSLAAAAAGFYDRPHLTRHFKRVLGTTPAAYARSAR
jgi:methylphosphotriester-DNA--protein-cysteine methyltransferase